MKPKLDVAVISFYSYYFWTIYCDVVILSSQKIKHQRVLNQNCSYLYFCSDKIWNQQANIKRYEIEARKQSSWYSYKLIIIARDFSVVTSLLSREET